MSFWLAMLSRPLPPGNTVCLCLREPLRPHPKCRVQRGLQSLHWPISPPASIRGEGMQSGGTKRLEGPNVFSQGPEGTVFLLLAPSIHSPPFSTCWVLVSDAVVRVVRGCMNTL